MKATIGKTTFNIELVEEFDTNDILGITLYASQTIKVLKTLSPESIRATLIHELTHAFMYVNGLKDFESFNREQLCEFVAWHSEEIIKLATKIMKELKDEHKD